ncbi:MAG: T9SS type A sorting domain-containing protein [Bacteroidales bacterium]|nr:T9SS type A sorting domain-containing protein [Bacteroidales bacterium]
MLRYLTILLLLLLYHPVSGQGPLGSWADHLPYHSVRFVSEGENEIYGSTEYAISIFNPSYNEVRKLSKVNGLSDTGISTIEYSKEEKGLVIAYESGNIDIYRYGEIRNIPDIMNYFISGDIKINRIRTRNEYAYLASNHGIIIVNIKKYEIKDTWRPSVDGIRNEVFDISISDDTVYAATGRGLFKAPADNQGLAYYGNWDLIGGSDENSYNCLASVNGNLFFNKQGALSGNDSVFYLSEGSLNYVPGLPGTVNYSFETGIDRLIISSGSAISILDASAGILSTIDEYGRQAPGAMDAIFSGNEIYVADYNQGLVRLRDGGSYENYIPQGPVTNNSFYLHASGGQVWVAGGGVNEDWNNLLTPFTLFNFSDRKWWSELRDDARDAMRVAAVPGEPDHIFVTTWGHGVYEFKNKQLLNHWSENTFGSSVPGKPLVRIFGLAVDKDKNLWITQSGIQNNIKVLTNDKNWISLPYHIDAPIAGDILITEANHKWILLPGGGGLFVLDDNHTPSYFDDDRYKKMAIKDQDGKVFSNVSAIARDLDGNIWIGSDQGPVVYYFPDRVFEQDIYATRIKIPRNDGSGLADYLLATETILSISVDGGNRKWLGTKNSGAYLISENSNELVKNFNVSNSPLLSDHVSSIATDGETGEVWFGTSMGIVTLRETGTTGSSAMDKVYAFPNPVREDFAGNITITGLTRNSHVKITDISGNLVYETRSTGGDASWDMKTYNGKKVSSGVYLVFCNNEDGTVSTVTKILIIR